MLRKLTIPASAPRSLCMKVASVSTLLRRTPECGAMYAASSDQVSSDRPGKTKVLVLRMQTDVDRASGCR